MGEVAEQVGQFVNAYSGDLRDESLDGQRVVVGGIVTGVRTVITKAKSRDGDRDARGPPGHRSRSSSSRACTRQTGPTWREGAILLVAGRVGPRARASALGEGAAGAVPVGAPDGRGGRAGRALRQRLLGRPQGRDARRAAGRGGRASSPALRTVITKRQEPMAIVTLEDLQGIDRGRRLPAPVRDDPRRPARRRDPAGRRTHRPQGRGGLPARRPRRRLGRRRGPRPRGVRPGRGGRRSVGGRNGGSGAAARQRIGSGRDRPGARGGTGCRPPSRAPAAGGRFAPPRRDAAGDGSGDAAAGLPRIQPGRAGPDLRRAPGTRAAGGDPTRTTSRPCPTRPAPGSWPMPRPMPRSTPGPEAVLHVRFERRPRPDRVVGRWRPSSRCCATGRARRGS